MNFAICPLNREGGPSQGTLGSNRFGVAKAIAKRSGIRRQAIRIGEVRGRFESGVLTELHENTNVMRERKFQIATREDSLERLLDCLLRVESNRRIRDSLVFVQGVCGGEVLTREGQQIAG
jgi:nitrogen regulatory protein PII